MCVGGSDGGGGGGGGGIMNINNIVLQSFSKLFRKIAFSCSV